MSPIDLVKPAPRDRKSLNCDSFKQGKLAESRLRCSFLQPLLHSAFCPCQQSKPVTAPKEREKNKKKAPRPEEDTLLPLQSIARCVWTWD
ncbi:hypothetical protein PoB_006507900 [Plakobranchus ocellatus]|uniref:Uncharacterized protein n=1 Tax=Plakobranchus ocellatus TaxID=259542 RepID=A0AAV4D311_9GAST|nr:hypothetical protein PoB_006507900 [Plakobranchus ocellatus]